MTAPTRRMWTLRRLRLGGVVALAATGLALWLPYPGGDGPAATAVPVAWARPVVSQADLAHRLGVRITQVAVTGGGGLVDLRFQVLDPATATAVHDPANPPAVVDDGTGLVVHELFMGHAHTDPFKAGVTYYFVFNDPVNWIHRGATVTVLLGDTQVEHLTVR